MAQTGSNADILAGLLRASEAAGSAGQQRVGANDQRMKGRASALEGLLGIGAAARQEEQLRQAKLAELFNQEATKRKQKLDEDQLGFMRKQNAEQRRGKAWEILHANEIRMGDPGAEEMLLKTERWLDTGEGKPDFIRQPMTVEGPSKKASGGFGQFLVDSATETMEMPPTKLNFLAGKAGLEVGKKFTDKVLGKRMGLKELLGIKDEVKAPLSKPVTYTPLFGRNASAIDNWNFAYRMGPDSGGKSYEAIVTEVTKAGMSGAMDPKEAEGYITALGEAERRKTEEMVGDEGAVIKILDYLGWW